SLFTSPPTSPRLSRTDPESARPFYPKRSTNFYRVIKSDFDFVPDTYLDWLLGETWFIQNYEAESVNVQKELNTRRRSHYHVEDQFGKVGDW
ncbi:hypothetical protein, partial [Candidatus Magnetobacterium casense]|uniref:hypothetical protein n=1 Tax=Candidatus Magnetobacterium casense TaxID=1455061 RepID=UPI001C44E10A